MEQVFTYLCGAGKWLGHSLGTSREERLAYTCKSSPKMSDETSDILLISTAFETKSILSLVFLKLPSLNNFKQH